MGGRRAEPVLLWTCPTTPPPKSEVTKPVLEGHHEMSEFQVRTRIRLAFRRGPDVVEIWTCGSSGALFVNTTQKECENLKVPVIPYYF